MVVAPAQDHGPANVGPGTKLGPYEIMSSLGVGGMGEVYRARDTRLGRSVAIKVLPQWLSQMPDLRQRLHHPNKPVARRSIFDQISFLLALCVTKWQLESNHFKTRPYHKPCRQIVQELTIVKQLLLRSESKTFRPSWP
jgi:serine/threonine protein kinase